MSQLPTQLSKLPHQVLSNKRPRDKRARLFPTLKPSSKELRATSTILAFFQVVPELFSEMISGTGISINNKTTFDTFTEVHLVKSKGAKKSRFDGFIYIKNRTEWTALVEAKVGNGLLTVDQIKTYVEDARANKIDAVITISNQFTSRVEQSPIDLNSPKGVKLYHLSWRLILSTALLLKNKNEKRKKDEKMDREKSLILEELIEFLRDDSVGNKAFTIMPKSWPEVCSLSRNNRLKFNDPQLKEVSSALVEEFSEIALILTDHLGVDCRAKVPRAAKLDKFIWQEQISKTIAEKSIAKCSYDIPNAANDLDLEINLTSSTISVGMEMKAPKEKSTSRGKINWLLKQLPPDKRQDKKSYIKVRCKSRSPSSPIELSKFESEDFKDKGFEGTILSLTPMMELYSSTVFQSRKNFIEELEKLVLNFYDTHAQNLKPWVSKPPAPLKKPEEQEPEEQEDDPAGESA